MKPKRSVDLTTGPILKQLILFTLPMLASNLHVSPRHSQHYTAQKFLFLNITFYCLFYSAAIEKKKSILQAVGNTLYCLFPG